MVFDIGAKNWRHHDSSAFTALRCADHAPVPAGASLFGRSMSCAPSYRNDFAILPNILAAQFRYLAESQSAPCTDQY
jgi:hypothetical protein